MNEVRAKYETQFYSLLEAPCSSLQRVPLLVLKRLRCILGCTVVCGLFGLFSSITNLRIVGTSAAIFGMGVSVVVLARALWLAKKIQEVSVNSDC